ncbi:phosphate ABC transporter substrate-binding protein, PhoT family [Geodermatophilus pulveris]|uniref:Phosphate-binding protein n=1 Tax=Geodermatophilus pulveris TaxID=1564159 RepID=A0A239AJB1_9ACTN|nr:phosphate ABC transporter substrate-binding protein PstS [Geodermatophilus pulveris]SNR95629.1 phosphate ABC transporter substrate-binding protein, PhoT family [Geodermatophilus pulveris]
MKLGTRTRGASLSLALAGTLALTACGAANEEPAAAGGGGETSGATEELSGTLVGAGASSQQAAMQGWTAAYSSVQPGVTVNYDPVGSGGGREQFVAGGVDFAGTDAALDEEELAGAQERCAGEGEVFELPNYIAPIAVVYNLEGVDELNLPPEVVAGIFAQQITNWNDPAIVEANPDATLPDLSITPVNRSDESGTTENFAEYLAAVAPDVWTFEPDGVWPVEGGESAQGTSGVVQAVGAGNGTIGYADPSQAGDLGIASIGVGEEFVQPTPEAASAVVENSERIEGRGEYDYAIDIRRDTTESGNYPIVQVSYHVGCITYPEQETADLVADFMSFVISEEGQQAAAEAAGSAPVSDTLREQAQGAIDAISAG